MDESHLNNNIRQKINYTLRSGESLPGMQSDRGDYRRIKYPPIIIKPGTMRRRTHNEIIQSGAYERDKFVPDHSKEDREAAKLRLQNLMAHGKDSQVKRNIRKTKSTENINCEVEVNKFDERKY